jgi:hypothetical protein
MTAIRQELQPFDEAVYDSARAICAEGAILGGSHALDDSATFATTSGIRGRLIRGRLAERRTGARPTGPRVAAALRRLEKAGLVKRVALEHRYKTRPARRLRYAGYVVVGEKP